MPTENVCQEISLANEILTEYTHLISYLRESWGKRGFKQKDLAAKAGVNATSLNKFINRGTVPSFDNMYRLIYAFLGRPPILIAPPLPETNAYRDTILQIADLLSKLPPHK